MPEGSWQVQQVWRGAQDACTPGNALAMHGLETAAQTPARELDQRMVTVSAELASYTRFLAAMVPYLSCNSMRHISQHVRMDVGGMISTADVRSSVGIVFIDMGGPVINLAELIVSCIAVVLAHNQIVAQFSR
jgi:hypothetical protein